MCCVVFKKVVCKGKKVGGVVKLLLLDDVVVL